MIDANEMLAIRKRWGHKERGESLRRLRERHGITLEELANKAGVTKQAISQFELGKTEPRFEREMKIHQALRDAMDERKRSNPDPKGIYESVKIRDLARPQGKK